MRVAALVALVASIAACYSPSIPDGIYQCTDSDRTCPQGMICNSCKLCVHAGSALDAGVCLSCGGLIQCYMDRGCQFHDTTCAQGCLSQGSPTAQQLGGTVLDCLSRVCASRCALLNGPSCTTCEYNFIRGPNSAGGACNPANDGACGQCVTEYNACTADRSGN